MQIGRHDSVNNQWGWGQERVIITYCCPEEQKALLTRELHKDVESMIGRLFWPELPDMLPIQHMNTILHELTKRISMYIKIYIELQKHRKVTVYAGLWDVVTLKGVRSL